MKSIVSFGKIFNQFVSGLLYLFILLNSFVVIGLFFIALYDPKLVSPYAFWTSITVAVITMMPALLNKQKYSYLIQNVVCTIGSLIQVLVTIWFIFYENESIFINTIFHYTKSFESKSNIAFVTFILEIIASVLLVYVVFKVYEYSENKSKKSINGNAKRIWGVVCTISAWGVIVAFIASIILFLGGRHQDGLLHYYFLNNAQYFTPILGFSLFGLHLSYLYDKYLMQYFKIS